MDLVHLCGAARGEHGRREHTPEGHEELGHLRRGEVEDGLQAARVRELVVREEAEVRELVGGGGEDGVVLRNMGVHEGGGVGVDGEVEA